MSSEENESTLTFTLQREIDPRGGDLQKESQMFILSDQVGHQNSSAPTFTHLIQ